MKRRGSRQRRGFTLYEVVIALAIFAGAVVALSQALSTGKRAALQARLQSQAVLLCESKMAEVVGGATPATASGEVAFTDSGLEGWSWSVNVAPSSHTGLNQVQVTVSFRKGDSVDTSFSMMRLLRDQQAFITSAIQASKDKATQAGITQQQSQATQ